MPTVTDHDALRAACLADPEDRTARGAFADYLEEHAESRQEPCPECAGNGSPYRVAGGYDPELIPCRHCSGTGTVTRSPDADRAELIRLRVELAVLGSAVCPATIIHPEFDFPIIEYGKRYVVPPPMPQKEPCGFCPVCRPRFRLAELLASNPQWTRADCPECGGKGRLLQGKEFPGRSPADECESCGGKKSGRDGTGNLFHGLTVDFDGVSLTVTAPTMQTWVWNEAFPEPDPERGVDGVIRPAPTPRLRAVAKVPGVEFVLAADREPYHNGAGYCWYDVNRERPVAEYIPDAAQLPTPVFAGIEGWEKAKTKGERWKPFPTRAAALRAFGVAMKDFGLEDTQCR